MRRTRTALVTTIFIDKSKQQNKCSVRWRRCAFLHFVERPVDQHDLVQHAAARSSTIYLKVDSALCVPLHPRMHRAALTETWHSVHAGGPAGAEPGDICSGLPDRIFKRLEDDTGRHSVHSPHGHCRRHPGLCHDRLLLEGARLGPHSF